MVVPVRGTPPAESSWRGNAPGRGRSLCGTNARGKGAPGATVSRRLQRRLKPSPARRDVHPTDLLLPTAGPKGRPRAPPPKGSGRVDLSLSLSLPLLLSFVMFFFRSFVRAFIICSVWCLWFCVSFCRCFFLSFCPSPKTTRAPFTFLQTRRCLCLSETDRKRSLHPQGGGFGGPSSTQQPS